MEFLWFVKRLEQLQEQNNNVTTTDNNYSVTGFSTFQYLDDYDSGIEKARVGRATNTASMRVYSGTAVRRLVHT